MREISLCRVQNSQQTTNSMISYLIRNLARGESGSVESHSRVTCMKLAVLLICERVVRRGSPSNNDIGTCTAVSAVLPVLLSVHTLQAGSREN